MKDSSKIFEAINFINEDYIHSAQQFLGISSPQEGEAEKREPINTQQIKHSKR